MYRWIWTCPYEAEGWTSWMDDQIGRTTLQTLWEQQVQGCTRCGLHSTRTHIVYGAGNTERPDFAFVGEGPGADEDRSGQPFVGRAGKLLDKILAAMTLRREECYICNVVACRPPNNRDPLPEELQACQPVWTSQLIAVRPRVIVALGKVAGNTLLGTKNEPIAKLRTRLHAWRGIPVQVTYHPAAMLRNETYKEPAWQDFQVAMAQVAAGKARAYDAGPLFGGPV